MDRKKSIIFARSYSALLADYEAVEAIFNKYEDVGEDDLFSLKILKDIKYCTYVIRMIKLK